MTNNRQLQPPPPQAPHAMHLPVDEPRRLAGLHALGVLDTALEPALDALVATNASLTGCAIAALCLIDADRQWFKATHGMPSDPLPRWRSVCTHTILGDGLLEVPDAAADPRFADHPAVIAAPHLRRHVGAPLRVGGANVGSLFAMDPATGPVSPAQRTARQQMAAIATALLEGRPRLNALEKERARLLDFARASGDWMWETDAHPAPHLSVEHLRGGDGHRAIGGAGPRDRRQPAARRAG